MYRNIFLFLTCLFANTLLLKSNFVYALDIDIKESIKNVVNQVVNKLPVTFKDQHFTNPSNKFNGDDTVYIKVNTSVTGEGGNDAWLLNENKEKIQKIILRRTESGSYTYLGEVKLPNSLGQYYLSINIKGDNGSFSFEQNIEVTNIITISPSPVITKVEINREEIKKNSITTALIDLVNKLILSIKSFLKIQP